MQLDPVLSDPAQASPLLQFSASPTLLDTFHWLVLLSAHPVGPCDLGIFEAKGARLNGVLRWAGFW